MLISGRLWEERITPGTTYLGINSVSPLPHCHSKRCSIGDTHFHYLTRSRSRSGRWTLARYGKGMQRRTNSPHHVPMEMDLSRIVGEMLAWP